MILKKKHVNVTTLMGGLRFLEIILLNQLLHIFLIIIFCFQICVIELFMCDKTPPQGSAS